MALNQKQFIFPYTFEERRPLIADRVLFIPSYYQAHHLFQRPAWNSNELFGNSQPIHVEFCSGNGEWIIDKAIKNPHLNFIACEIKFYRVRKIWVKIKQLNLANVLIAFGDANDFIRYYLQTDEVDAIAINFPDPWPKEKHAKNRLIVAPFIAEMKRVLKHQGDITIVTDHEAYCNQIIHEMQHVLTPRLPAPYYIEETVEYGTSYFYRYFKELGKKIRMMVFEK